MRTIIKKELFIISLVLLLISACSGVKTTTRGLENESYIELVGNPQKYRNVNVTIDNQTSFSAIVNSANRKVKGQVYAIKSGKSEVTIHHNNSIIYKQTIFTSPQETKRIILQ
jgi:hypothetical protein